MDYVSFITNFQAPQNLQELKNIQERGNGSNLDLLLSEYKTETDWTVPSDATIGMIVFFMCAKSAIDYRHLAGVRKQARESGDTSLISLAEEQYASYAKYAGKIMIVGRMHADPYKRSDDATYPGWGAKIRNMILLDNPVDISEFKTIVKISNTNAITKLNESQYQHLIRLVERRNPGFISEFGNKLFFNLQTEAIPSLDEIIGGMTDEELEGVSTNTSSGPAPSYSSTVVLRRRDPILPEKVKRRAKGMCQLCLKPAPFLDKNGKPYLEAHHIVPLASNGPDIISNMVALCPNCHRKMHVLAEKADVEKLKSVALQ